MARTTIVAGVLILVAGALFALLPAQDPAWRPSSGNMAEPAVLPADIRENTAQARLVAADSLPLQDNSDIGPIAANETGVPMEGEAAQPAAPIVGAASMKSVLKRPRGTSAAMAEIKSAEASSAPILAAVPAQSGSEPAPEAQPLVPPGAASSRRTMQNGQSRASSRAARPENAAAGSSDLSLISRYPSLQVELLGPSAIQVGKTARYVIQVTNDGDSAAADIQVRLPLPGWISLTKAEATAGEAQLEADAGGSPRILWNLPTVQAGATSELRLDLIAAEGQPFDLNIEWACQSQTLQGRIAVKQPQLDLLLAGPADMLFGEEKVFTLTVANPGSGEATGITVQIASGGNRPKEIDVGSIPAGEQVEIPVQVVANQAGELALIASATGDGNLKADAQGKVLVRQPALAVAVDAPELQFAGAEATYVVTVSNGGNAAAENVQLSADLPAGAKYVGGVSGAEMTNGKIAWTLGSLAAGAEKQFEIRCQLLAEGANLVAVQAAGKAGLSATGEAATQVEAISELKLVVTDPSGPSPVGQEISYDLQIMNRGSRSAKNVKILMQFGEGIEPVEMSGGQGRIVPGQVVCEPLPELAAGEQVTLRIKAKAQKTGTHRYRVEVTSAEEARLVSEGTTRFFTESRAAAVGRTAKKSSPTPAAIRR